MLCRNISTQMSLNLSSGVDTFQLSTPPVVLNHLAIHLN